MTARDSNDDDLDETIDETFPASDAPGNTVETGIHLDALPTSAAVTDNREARRFELIVEGQTAVLNYERTPKSIVLVHTEVPVPLRGHHIADVLAKAAIDRAHTVGLQVIAVCPFVKAYLRKHPESRR